MQTFLPYPDFGQSAKVLDRQRLGKQRVEALQILYALTKENYGWQNHPAVKMWRGHELALVDYGIAICDEWILRGYKDTCRLKIERVAENLRNSGSPYWLGDVNLHRSHRSNLLRKNPEHYWRLFEQNLPMGLDYVWPIAEGEKT